MKACASRPAWSLLLLILGTAVPSQPQTSSFEEEMRQHLRKLDRWGIRQLLRAEKQIDQVQRERARISSSPAELAGLAADEDSGVRFYVAVNRHSPIEVLQMLAADPEAQVRSGVAMSMAFEFYVAVPEKQVLETIALGLARDSQVLVRIKLAENRRLTSAVFETLAQDVDHLVRLRVAQNPHAAQSALVLLAQDSVEAVQVAALAHRNTPPALLESLMDHLSPRVRLAICANINAPLLVLDHLAQDSDVQVRRAVARHPNTSLSTLERLRADSDLEVLLAIIDHPRADRRILMKLARDDRDGGVRMAAQKRLEPLLRDEIREDILERWHTR